MVFRVSRRESEAAKRCNSRVGIVGWAIVTVLLPCESVPWQRSETRLSQDNCGRSVVLGAKE